MSNRALAALGLLSIALSGCADMCPDIYHPGPEGYQRLRAQRMDPYPDPDVGPEVVGGRPREYEVPPPEAVRAANPPPQLRKQYRP